MKLTQFKQKNIEQISKYMKKTSNITRKLLNDEIDVRMIILREMREIFKREQINFECNKEQDYNFVNVNKLIKIAYNEIDKSNSFDSNYKNVMQIILSYDTITEQTNDELLKQMLINSNQVFSTMLQTFRNLNVTTHQNITMKNAIFTRNQISESKDISIVRCYKCNELEHYASNHNKKILLQSKITKIKTILSISISQSLISSITKVIFNVVISASSRSILQRSQRFKMKSYASNTKNEKINEFAIMIVIIEKQKRIVSLMTTNRKTLKQKKLNDNN